MSPDQPPAARRGRGVDAGVGAGQADRAGRHARPRSGAAGHRPLLAQAAQVGEARGEAAERHGQRRLDQPLTAAATGRRHRSATSARSSPSNAVGISTSGPAGAGGPSAPASEPAPRRSRSDAVEQHGASARDDVVDGELAGRRGAATRSARQASTCSPSRHSISSAERADASYPHERHPARSNGVSGFTTRE